MSDLYASLGATPRKKRCPPVYDDDEDVITPKKIRTLPRTPPTTSSRRRIVPTQLPAHLTRLQNIQSSLNRALAHSLATSAVSPASDTGIVPNVLNHHTLTTAAGLSTNCTLDDLKRLCWIWEWDGKGISDHDSSDSENPFLESSTHEQPKQWTRGAMGLVITPTTHLSKTAGRRIPAYGLGIEVEMNIDKDMHGGMAAVARWTAAGELRMKELVNKFDRWVQLHSKATAIPFLPLADLPPLIQATKQSSLTQRLASLSPKSPKSMAGSSTLPLHCPPSPSRSSPSKPRVTPGKRSTKDFAIPFPITPASHPRTKSTIPFPQTPSSRGSTSQSQFSTPQTPSENKSTSSVYPSTPVHQSGSNAETAPDTPTTSRRAALYERIRKRSESLPSTPSKTRITSAKGMSKDQLLKLGQEELRRRCLLGRLGGVAESIWMLFSTPAPSATASPSPRKRRTLPTSEVAQAIIKSSPVPISAAEALESITLLTSLCPFFLKSIEVGAEEWLEMPPASTTPPSPSKTRLIDESEDELKTLSPKRVKKEGGGLREVRERIKKELEAD